MIKAFLLWEHFSIAVPCVPFFSFHLNTAEVCLQIFFVLERLFDFSHFGGDFFYTTIFFCHVFFVGVRGCVTFKGKEIHCPIGKNHAHEEYGTSFNKFQLLLRPLYNTNYSIVTNIKLSQNWTLNIWGQLLFLACFTFKLLIRPSPKGGLCMRGGKKLCPSVDAGVIKVLDLRCQAHPALL